MHPVALLAPPRKVVCECEWCGDDVYDDEPRHRLAHQLLGLLICSDCFDDEGFECPGCDHTRHDSDRYDPCPRCGVRYCAECEDLFDDRECPTCYVSPEWDRHPYGEDWGRTLAEGEEAQANTLLIGVELEVETHDPRDVIRSAHAQPFRIFCYPDGSLTEEGVEMATRPFSVQWYNENRAALTKWVRDVSSDGGEARSNCGLHIHLASSAFTDTLHLYKFMKVIYENREEVYRLAGRRSESWASLENEPTTRLLEKAERKNNLGNGRYTGVNLETGGRTVEVRLFHSTLNPDRLHRRIQFLLALFEYTETVPSYRCGWDGFAGFVRVKRERYPELQAWMESDQRDRES